MTTAVAIWGAVLSTGLAVFTVLSYLRDRPQLHLTLKTDSTRGRPPAIGIDVSNRGRQPTTLMEVGFFADVETSAQDDKGGPPIPLRPKIVMPGTPRILAVGEAAQFRRELTAWPGILHADDPLRGYVVDSHGHTSWAGAFPLLRLIVGHGWRPAGVDPRAFEPVAGPRYSTPVEPRWKLWLDESLRKKTDVSIEAMTRLHAPSVDVTFSDGAQAPGATPGPHDPPRRAETE